MTKLIFKESLDSKDVIEVAVLTWMSSKEGIYAKTLEGWKMFSNSLILWEVKEF